MQTKNPILNRPNLSEDLKFLVREMILDGRLTAGERINEVHLSESLGVSRTPLREALAGLASEGALTSIPRRGFTVCPLTVEEALSIYPIRGILDPEALRLSGLPPADRLGHLADIVTELSQATDARDAIHLDDSWHLTLYENCPNRELIELIEQFMRRTRRYELASMGELPIIQRSTESKTRIIESLRTGNLPQACSRLRKSLETGVEPVIEWLTRSQKGQS